MALMHYTATVRPDWLLELPSEARQRMKPGQKIEIDIDIDETQPQAKPNERLLAMLRDLEEMKREMPESDPSDTNRIIREGRAGAMYGQNSTE